jgi:hypothetical protein
LGGRKERVKKRAALSIFEAEMLSQSVSYDLFPTIDIRTVIITLVKVSDLTTVPSNIIIFVPSFGQWSQAQGK